MNAVEVDDTDELALHECPNCSLHHWSNQCRNCGMPLPGITLQSLLERDSEMQATPKSLQWLTAKHPQLQWLTQLKPAPRNWYRHTDRRAALARHNPTVTPIEWRMILDRKDTP